MIPPIYPINPDKDAYTNEEAEMLDKMHKEKIKLSDAIFVVNIHSYIGESTKSFVKFSNFWRFSSLVFWIISLIEVSISFVFSYTFDIRQSSFL